MGTLYYDILKLCGNNKEKIWNDKATLKVINSKEIISLLIKNNVKFKNVLSYDTNHDFTNVIEVEGAYTPFILNEWNGINKRKQCEFDKNKLRNKYYKYTKHYYIYEKGLSYPLYEDIVEYEIYRHIYELYKLDKENDCFIDYKYDIINMKDNDDRHTISEFMCIDYLEL